VFGGHPLITPIIFEVAAGELAGTPQPERVVLFQSRHFADTLPPQVWSFREAPWASVHDIDGAPPEKGDSESTVREKRAVALGAMRDAMIGEFGPYTAAIFIGGKDGISDEFKRIKLRPEAVLCYPIKRPGGMARSLSLDDRIDDQLNSRLRTSGAYTNLARRIVANIAEAGRLTTPGIVVGIDGSDNSRKALEWAVREAGVRGAPLTVVAVHEVASNHWTGDPETYASDRPETEMVREAAKEAVQKAVSQVGEPQPTSITVHTVSGLPAQELVAASAGADLLVVGSTGGGGFSRMVLGSVTSQVASHAESPVVVIR